MSRPRILVNSVALTLGGGRAYMTNLLREWARDDRGFRYTVLALPGLLEGMDTRGVDVRTVRIPDLPMRRVWRVGYEELVLPFRAREFDLLFCVADLAPVYTTTPTVVLLRNLNIYDRRWYDDSRTRTLARLVRLGLPNARRILFPSRAAADEISARMPVPQERVRVVHYGVSLDVFEGADEVRAEVPYLFLPAAVERHKNIEVLIDCLPSVKDPRLEVWVAGTSPLDPQHRGRLERRAEALGVANRVRFLGAVPYARILGYYRSATAFVFPSFIETFGHPLLEAMACGTPAIAADIPCFREIAAEAALFFPPTDPVALARAVDRVQEDAEATRHRVALGRSRAAHFSWKRSADELARVFDELLGRSSPAGGAGELRTGSR